MRESEGIIRDLQSEEEREIKHITQACKKKVSTAADYIAREIVKY